MRDAKSFNSRDPCGSRRMTSGTSDAAGTFQLTRPARVATKTNRRYCLRLLFQLTRPARVATIFAWISLIVAMFQLTRPARVATHRAIVFSQRIICFNSRDPHGSRLAVKHFIGVGWRVSTHATRTGRDREMFD